MPLRVAAIVRLLTQTCAPDAQFDVDHTNGDDAAAAWDGQLEQVEIAQETCKWLVPLALPIMDHQKMLRITTYGSIAPLDADPGGILRIIRGEDSIFFARTIFQSLRPADDIGQLRTVGRPALYAL